MKWQVFLPLAVLWLTGVAASPQMRIRHVKPLLEHASRLFKGPRHEGSSTPAIEEGWISLNGRLCALAEAHVHAIEGADLGSIAALYAHQLNMTLDNTQQQVEQFISDIKDVAVSLGINEGIMKNVEKQASELEESLQPLYAELEGLRQKLPSITSDMVSDHLEELKVKFKHIPLAGVDELHKHLDKLQEEFIQLPTTDLAQFDPQLKLLQDTLARTRMTSMGDVQEHVDGLKKRLSAIIEGGKHLEYLRGNLGQMPFVRIGNISQNVKDRKVGGLRAADVSRIYQQIGRMREFVGRSPDTANSAEPRFISSHISLIYPFAALERIHDILGTNFLDTICHHTTTTETPTTTTETPTTTTETPTTTTETPTTTTETPTTTTEPPTTSTEPPTTSTEPPTTSTETPTTSTLAGNTTTTTTTTTSVPDTTTTPAATNTTTTTTPAAPNTTTNSTLPVVRP